MNAALLTKGLTFSKHSGVIAAFSQHLVKTGIIPREVGRKLTRLRRDREIGDYDDSAQGDESSAQIDVSTASEIDDRVRRGLIENQFIS
ncbi:MAG: HEPN domain-containing protein [Planctomycetes bacterium]|nr:HEPN domain-containing protein [Planctomycetota bacterium]MBI3843372.1 HEPN domain-containing protein [Planctomycetota bacterium]